MCGRWAAPSVSRMTTLALDGLKAKQQKTWASGDYGAVAALIQPISDKLVEAADLAAGSRVLDVATGTGNAAIAAARCRCDVVGVDYVPALLDRARERAAAERFTIKFVEADAEALPCTDGEYDAVLSVVGAMFAPDQEAVASELLRVCRPGGTIALANWTPDGFIGDLFRTVGRRVPPPPGVRAPVEWGSEPRVRELLGPGVPDLTVTTRVFTFRFTSAAAFADYFRAHYGPTLKAFEALDEDSGALLHADLVELADRHNVSTTDPSVRIPAAYAEVVGHKAK